MKIYIPSTRRSTRQETLFNIPKKLRRNVVLVVHADDWYQYQPFEAECEVWPVPYWLKGIAPKRRLIMERAAAEGRDKICMIDDDLKFYVRRDPTDWHLVYCNDQEMENMFDMVEESLEPDIPLIGVSPREGNNWMKDDWAFNVRLTRFIAIHTPTCHAITQFGDIRSPIQVMEDFQYILDVLKAGHQNAGLYRYAQGQARGMQADGGCSVWRTHEIHESSARALAKRHPDCCQIVEKTNKTGGEFGKRVEIRVGWKQAYLLGKSAIRENMETEAI